MNEYERKRWENEQESFCKTFILALIIGTFWLLFIGTFGGISWISWILFDPLVFFLSDIFLAFGISVVSWIQYKKKVRKQEGKTL